MTETDEKSQMTPFARRVYAVVSRIPRGRTLTYAQVAAKAGRPRAARAVGNLMNCNPFPITKVPCHRVVRSDGSVGGYAWGAAKKKTLLRREGAL
ncbi:MAG TPA: MGMT family protein [Candidatus Paceibacterota bacterium]|nr:MGMT family protein [Candidatus Paceibacterota bacterium]